MQVVTTQSCTTCASAQCISSNGGVGSSSGSRSAESSSGKGNGNEFSSTSNDDGFSSTSSCSLAPPGSSSVSKLILPLCPDQLRLQLVREAHQLRLHQDPLPPLLVRVQHALPSKSAVSWQLRSSSYSDRLGFCRCPDARCYLLYARLHNTCN
ncbi:hypothetical protein B0H19DRAFT_1365041 [Mycena capillaripes]|nr:hypothetical protein B0H19DRAFT_1365041 [Mycena capillaripes]